MFNGFQNAFSPLQNLFKKLEKISKTLNSLCNKKTRNEFPKTYEKSTYNRARNCEKMPGFPAYLCRVIKGNFVFFRYLQPLRPVKERNKTKQNTTKKYIYKKVRKKKIVINIKPISSIIPAATEKTKRNKKRRGKKSPRSTPLDCGRNEGEVSSRGDDDPIQSAPKKEKKKRGREIKRMIMIQFPQSSLKNQLRIQ